MSILSRSREYIEPNSYAEENYPLDVCPHWAGARRLARNTDRKNLLSEMPIKCPNAKHCPQTIVACKVVSGDIEINGGDKNLVYEDGAGVVSDGRVNAFMHRLEQHEAIVSGR